MKIKYNNVCKSKKLIQLTLFYLLYIPFVFFNIAHSAAIDSTSEAEVFQIPSMGTFKLDGNLNEPFWMQVSPIGPLTMVTPDEGGQPTEKTEIRISATIEAILFGIVCHDSQPDGIVSFTMQRDAELRGEDHVKIVLDTFLNGRTGYVFSVNPNGARRDALIAREGEGENSDWDGIWEAAVRRFEKGWSAEIYIPIKTLRFRTGLTQWGFNVERRIQRLQETDRWASPIRNFKVTHISKGGQLMEIPDFQQGMGLTVRPYLVGSQTNDCIESMDTKDFQPGLDIMKNFGGNVTGLVSVNTDFAETEVDTRRSNLTRFPLFFPEKRTFFLEGSDIYDFGLGMGDRHDRDIVPFFTRRIGLVEEQAVPLDLSLKATGSIGRFNFGMLDSFSQSVDGLTPRTNLFAARGFQNIWEESKLGFLVTAGDPLGRSGSWLGGVDFVYKTSRFQGNKNFLVGFWALVNNRDGLGKDRSAFGFKVDFPNDLWDVSWTVKRLGTDFDPSMGFVPWKGIYKTNINLTYKPRPSWPWLRQMRHELFTHFVTDLDGKLYQYRIFMSPFNWRLESGDRIELKIFSYMERLPESFDLTDDVYVSTGEYRYARIGYEFHSASKRKLKTEISGEFGKFYNGNMHQTKVELEWRPSHQLNISLEGERNKGSLPSGSMEILLGRSRLNFYFSPNFQIISYLQYDNLSKSLGINTRLRWTYRSILDVFLVYNRKWFETEGRLSPQLNQFFIKIQYAWRN